MSSKQRKIALSAGAVAILVVVGIIGVNVWLNGGDAPAAFESSSGSQPRDTSKGSTLPRSGEWIVDPDQPVDSGVGYRIIEDVPVAGEQVIVARTQAVEGMVVVEGSTLSSATLNLAIDSLASDNTARDGIVASTYLEAESFPTASIAVREPIKVSARGGTAPLEIPAELELHGVKQPVTIVGTAEWSKESIELVGTIDVTLGQFDIERPDLLGRSARDEATVEFKLQLVPK